MTRPLLVFLGTYLSVLFLLGWWGHRAGRTESLRDFYLAGGRLGALVLLATLYASQYSGNTFLGYTGRAYRMGFVWVFSVGMMMSVVLVYLVFAPRLHDDAHRHGLVTPGDWLTLRFGDRRLSLLATLVMIVALLNYLYAQFLAAGHMAVRLSGGEVPFWVGVTVMGVVIGSYETLGGMRAVAWTDVVQGALLFGGLAIVLFLAWAESGGLPAVAPQLQASDPAALSPPGPRLIAYWLSSTALLAFGAAVYPHAIQRIYAARTPAVLRRSLRFMVLMPFATTMVVLVLGILAHGILPAPVEAEDQVMPSLLSRLAEGGAGARWAVAAVITAALAAIMSTADSALLSLSSLLTRDVFGAALAGRWTEAALTRLGKWVSWGLVALLVFLALRPPATLWRLIEIKMELLIQTAPLFLFGARVPQFDARAAWAGFGTGLVLATGAMVAGTDRLAGFHAGTLAFACNVAVCGLATFVSRRGARAGARGLAGGKEQRRGCSGRWGG